MTAAKKKPHMNTENLDLSCIELQQYMPDPARPGSGYLVHDRTLSYDELDKLLRKRVPQELYGRFESFGLSVEGRFDDKTRKQPVSATGKPEDAKHTYLTTDWEPGSNEGFYTHVYAVRYGDPNRRRVIWTAKAFDLHATIALDMLLHCLLYHGSRYEQHATKQVLQHITFN